jgi:hypothetical protein
MLVAIRSNVARLKSQRRTLGKIIAANLTADFGAKWGNFLITPAFFTSLVYRGV